MEIPIRPIQLRKEATTSPKSLVGFGSQSDSVLRFGAYGEFKFGSRETTDQGWVKGFDAGRVTLLPTIQIAPNIIFNAELEFEHGGIARDDDDKLNGSVDVEQAYIDFKFNDYFNWRAPGVDVVPFGYTNLFHEPVLFYSVDRPELANGLIPTTWFGGATTIYGKIVDNLTYQFQINTGLEDVGSKDGVPARGTPYPAGISGVDAFALSRTPVGDFSQTKNALGYAFRLAYTPPWIPGLAGSTSFFYTPNVTPRGAFADTGVSLGHSSVAMFDTELRYRIPHTGFEFRGEFVYDWLGTPRNLRANNDGDPFNNVGKHMYGASVEAAYHFDLSRAFKNGGELVPFFRYTYENFQTGGYAGSDLNTPTGQGQRNFYSMGLAYFPIPKVVLKLNYVRATDHSGTSPKADSFLGGVGFFF